MVLDAPYPEDGRVTKEATALVSAGHEVYLLCVRRTGEDEEADIGGIHICRIERGLSELSKTLHDSLNAIRWRHLSFDRELPGFIERFGIQALHVHDLPLAGSVRLAANSAQLPWVLDLHENYPAGLQVWHTHKTNPLVRLKNWALFGYQRWTSYERRMVLAADAVIAVVEEMKQRLMDLHELPSEHIYIVTNSEWRDFMAQFSPVAEARDSYPDNYVLLYLGYFGPHRGVDTVIEAMPGILTEIPEARFVIIGRGSLQPKLERLADSLGVADRVDFLGFKPYAQVGSWMQRADVNVIPHKRNGHTDNTVPHKLFQSMQSGRPTLVSSSPPLARIAAETGGAAVFEAENPKSLAEAVIELHSNQHQREGYVSAAIKHTVEGDYNWDTDSQNLVALYDELSRMHAI